MEGADLEPAERPLVAEIVEGVELAAAFPIDVDGAEGFTAENAGGEVAVESGEDKYGVAPRVGARPGGKLGEVGSMQTRVVDHAAQEGDGEECGDGDGGRKTYSGERSEGGQGECETDAAPDEGAG